jgi:hypothetical protein
MFRFVVFSACQGMHTLSHIQIATPNIELDLRVKQKKKCNLYSSRGCACAHYLELHRLFTVSFYFSISNSYELFDIFHI